MAAGALLFDPVDCDEKLTVFVATSYVTASTRTACVALSDYWWSFETFWSVCTLPTSVKSVPEGKRIVFTNIRFWYYFAGIYVGVWITHTNIFFIESALIAPWLWTEKLGIWTSLVEKTTTWVFSPLKPYGKIIICDIPAHILKKCQSQIRNVHKITSQLRTHIFIINNRFIPMGALGKLSSPIIFQHNSFQSRTVIMILGDF